MHEVRGYKGRKVTEPDFLKKILIWRYSRKRPQISPKSDTLISPSKIAQTIFSCFWPEVSSKYDLRFEWNLCFRKICYFEIFDLVIVKIWLFSNNSQVQSMYSCYRCFLVWRCSTKGATQECIVKKWVNLIQYCVWGNLNKNFRILLTVIISIQVIPRGVFRTMSNMMVIYLRK